MKTQESPLLVIFLKKTLNREPLGQEAATLQPSVTANM